MNILYLAYWGLKDGLTISTALPHVKLLEENDCIERIIFCTIEREEHLEERALSRKVLHIPLQSSHRYVSKICDFLVFPATISRLITQYSVAFMFCRGTPAGAIGFLVHRKINVAYAVESFEPHADYMRESGVWPRWGIRYILQKHWEKMQIKTAQYIMPVSRQYIDYLASRNVERSKMLLMPCAVNLQAFVFNEDDRLWVRQLLGIDRDTVVGIYVGKFGGMYFDDDAFFIFGRAKKHFKDFYLIVLTPEKDEVVTSRLLSNGYLPEHFHIKHVHHSDVPRYLSAADFAFATYKPGLYKRFLSPVKIGEYWASGLPVLLTDGVGDDHQIVKSMGAGAVYDHVLSDLTNALVKLEKVVLEGRGKNNDSIRLIAERYRNFNENALVYEKIIDALLPAGFAGSSTPRYAND